MIEYEIFSDKTSTLTSPFSIALNESNKRLSNQNENCLVLQKTERRKIYIKPTRAGQCF